VIEFQLPDMTCGHCVKAVTQALREVDPEARVEIDLPAHRVRVESTRPRETLAAALAEAGYQPALA
jgi:copper chaperone